MPQCILQLTHILIFTQGDWKKYHGANKDLLYVIEPVIESLLQVSSFHFHFSFYSYFHFHFPLSHAIEPVIESLLQLLVQSILVYVVLGPRENEDDWRRTAAGEQQFLPMKGES